MFRSMGRNDEQLNKIRKSMQSYFESDWLKDIDAYVAVVEDEIVGGIAVSFFRMMPSASNATGIIGHIYNLYVEPDFRNMGIATGLLYRVLQLCGARKAGKITLHATDLGLGIYLKIGFKKRENYYELAL